MKSRPLWSCVAALVLMAVFSAGCAEDIPTRDLSKLSAAPKPKQEEPKTETDPALTPEAAPDAASEQPMADPSGAVPPPAPTGQSGYGQTGQSGYGQTGASDTSVPVNTYGHGAPILLKSEVSQADVMVANGRIGRKGQGYGGGIITEPLSQYFQIQTRIEFLNMKNWIKNFWALNNNQSPPTVEEFDAKILKEAGVTLPELSPGQFYVYDPSAKDLDLVLTVGQNKPM